MAAARPVRPRHPQRRAGRPHPVVRPAGSTGSSLPAGSAPRRVRPSRSRSLGWPGSRSSSTGRPTTRTMPASLRRRHEGDPDVTFHEAAPPDGAVAAGSLRLGRSCVRATGTNPSAWSRPRRRRPARRSSPSHAADLTEIIDDAVTGFLVEPGNVARAVAAVRSVASLTGDVAGSMRSTTSTSKRASPGYEALYASVAGRRAPTGGLASSG